MVPETVPTPSEAAVTAVDPAITATPTELCPDKYLDKNEKRDARQQ